MFGVSDLRQVNRFPKNAPTCELPAWTTSGLRLLQGCSCKRGQQGLAADQVRKVNVVEPARPLQPRQDKARHELSVQPPGPAQQKGHLSADHACIQNLANCSRLSCHRDCCAVCHWHSMEWKLASVCARTNGWFCCCFYLVIHNHQKNADS